VSALLKGPGAMRELEMRTLAIRRPPSAREENRNPRLTWRCGVSLILLNFVLAAAS